MGFKTLHVLSPDSSRGTKSQYTTETQNGGAHLFPNALLSLVCLAAPFLINSLYLSLSLSLEGGRLRETHVHDMSSLLFVHGSWALFVFLHVDMPAREILSLRTHSMCVCLCACVRVSRRTDEDCPGLPSPRWPPWKQEKKYVASRCDIDMCVETWNIQHGRDLRGWVRGLGIGVEKFSGG